MEALSVGPVSLPVALVVATLAIAASFAAGAWWRLYRAIDVGPVLLYVLAGSLVAARAGFVLSHLDVYTVAPFDVLNLSDGGFNPSAGIFAGFVIGAELTRQARSLQKPLVTAAFIGAVAWMLGMSITQRVDGVRAPIPAVELKRLDGTTVDLRSLAGKPMILNLWASWCPPCRREIPVLQAAQARHPDILFVFVNQGEDPELIRRYFGAEGAEPSNVFSDRMGKVGKQIGAPGLPTTLFYDKRGALIDRQLGELSVTALEEKIVSLRAAP